MDSSLPKYLAQLLSRLTPLDPRGKWAFQIEAQKHPGWRPALLRGAERRASLHPGRFSVEELADTAEDHVVHQACVRIAGRGVGLALLLTNTEDRNWAILTNTIRQGTRRSYKVRIVEELNTLASMHETVHSVVPDPLLMATLVALLDRYHIRPLRRRLDLSGCTTIQDLARLRGLSTKELVDLACATLRTALYGSEVVDRQWAARVMRYFDQDWKY